LRLKIRPFRQGDLEQLTEFWRELQSDPVVAGDFCLLSEENVTRWQRYVMKVHEEDEEQILVAEIAGKIVGYVFFLSRAEFPLETRYTWASINELYVHPEHRRKGIATELMKQAFKHLKSMGVTYMRLNVMTENHAAIELYRKLGFRDHSLRMQIDLTTPHT